MKSHSRDSLLCALKLTLLHCINLTSSANQALKTMQELFIGIGEIFKQRAVMASSPLLKKRKTDNKACVICTRKCGEPQKNPNREEWDRFKNTAAEWERVRGKFSHVHESVNWTAGSTGVIWHKNCKWQMMNTRSLLQATRHYQSHYASSASSSTSSFEDDSKAGNHVEFHTTRQSTGTIIGDDSCVWCRKMFDEKHKDRNCFRTLEQMNTWYKFVASVPYVQDNELRERLRVLVTSTTDPLAAKIQHHVNCFKKYMQTVYDGDSFTE